jgi:hypothetical protein
MWNDIDWGFRDVCAQSDKPAYARILDIRRKGYSPAGKTLKRRCVEKSRKRGYERFHTDDVDGVIELHHVQSRKGYIAVSCPWQLPSPDDNVTEKYRIEPDSDMEEINHPQDAVLDRAINFVEYDEKSEGLPFWIDRLCIDQLEGSDEKEIAVQSMDLIYKQSTLSLGLLFVRIDSKEQIERLHDLMSGNCVTDWQNDQEKIEYSLAISLKKAREVLDVLDLMIKDTWWERAWIFQEDYLSGLRMRLLIRSSQSRYLRSSMGFGDIPGELEVGAAGFRREATRFCLAFRQRTGISKEEKSLCAEILKKAGKYSILLRRNNAGKTLKAMSPTIFEDIRQRNASRTLDILAIAANSCDYSERLDTKKLQEEKESLSLAILTMYILNGEILRHDSTAGEHLVGNICELLRHNTLDIEPPLEEKGLTFIKHCRFPNVALSRAGIGTEGIIWKLGKKINTSSFSWTPQEGIDSRDLGHEALWLLVTWLLGGEGRTYKVLAGYLTNFLEKTAPEGYVEDWTWRHIMHMMAISVVRAIQGGKQLQLGSVYCGGKYSPYTAIFVRDGADPMDNECFAFTSWACAKEVTKGNFLENSCSKYASLEVDYHHSMVEPPSIVPQRWINGLCFFSNTDANKVTVPWPKSIGG